ncbi:hypothetical protein [Cohnella silvisoli]|uniref:Uncharacterized protein n=1 Tax=Cohnella silvisoli TaxID=2873699 RepID=A0ABV1KY47_9BACL|nr:hypothetical protein [Cohnella silvisoli]MCD9021929.1 hypothetical protein [Cohnella silvisoli]
MKQIKYYKLLLGIVVLLLIFFSFSQYKTKEMYKSYISNNLNADFRQLITTIQNNNSVYSEVLISESISQTQVNSLMRSNESIRDIILKYREMAIKFNMREDDFQHDQSSLNAIKITRLSYDWDEAHESVLDANTKIIISKVQELNNTWLSAIKEGDHYSLYDSSWLKLLENIEISTLKFMSDNNIENIEAIWLQRTDIK